MSGTVVDAQTGAALSWTNVFVFELLGTSTDAEGRFRLETGAGTHTLRVTRVGYVAMEQVLEVPAEGLAELVLRLQPQVLPMAETLVERRRPIPPTFEDVTAVAGLAFEHVYGEGYLSDILEATGAGACFFDYNGDGFADLYFVNGSADTAEGEAPPANTLYRSNGDGTFTDVGEAVGVADTGYGMGCAAADYDNDGDVDLYVTNHGPNRLYRNSGDGPMDDVAPQAGVTDPRWSVAPIWADYDNDGFIDLYVANYLDFDPDERAMRSLVSLHEGYRSYPGPRDYDAQPDALYANGGDGRFTDVSDAVGLNHPYVAKGMGAASSDYDGDGDMDLFVANDRTPNQLYRNDDGVFVDIALWAGVAYDEAGHESGAMGVDFGDYDSDGDMDLFVTNFVFEYNALYQNVGEDTFIDVTERVGLAQPSYRFIGWGTGFLDYDNDGYLDLFVANGHVHEDMDVLSESVTFAQPNQLFRNNGDGTFADVSTSSGPHFLEAHVSRGVAFADYDNDGDTDILVLSAGGPARLLQNNGGNRENWLALRLVGCASNRDAVGARIRVRAGDLDMVREVDAGSSYLSQNEMRLQFGLGGYRRVDLVQIRWPSGRIDTLTGVQPNRLLVVTEVDGPTGLAVPTDRAISAR